MLLHKKFFTVLMLFFLTACGFSPVYKTQEENGGEVMEELAAIEIAASHDLMGQFFKTRLEDLFNPVSKQVPAKYRMEVSLGKSETPLAIQEDRTITRYKVTLSARYNLTDIATGNVIDSGNIKREGGYDKVDSDYATYISQEDTVKRILRELAEDARVRVMSAVLGI